MKYIIPHRENNPTTAPWSAEFKVFGTAKKAKKHSWNKTKEITDESMIKRL